MGENAFVFSSTALGAEVYAVESGGDLGKALRVSCSAASRARGPVRIVARVGRPAILAP